MKPVQSMISAPVSEIFWKISDLCGLKTIIYSDQFLIVHFYVAGVAHRGASIRIPRGVSDAGCGYFEDRRPSSNCDPYSVVSRILKTIIVEK